MRGWELGLLKREPIAIAALIISVVGLLPIYYESFFRSEIAWSFECDPISPVSEGEYHFGNNYFGLLSLNTECVFTNTGNRTISVENASGLPALPPWVFDAYADIGDELQDAELIRLDKSNIRLAVPKTVGPGVAVSFDAKVFIVFSQYSVELWSDMNKFYEYSCGELVSNPNINITLELISRCKSTKSIIIFDATDGEVFFPAPIGHSVATKFGVKLQVSDGQIAFWPALIDGYGPPFGRPQTKLEKFYTE